jgi:hypothetical protein
MPRVVASKIGLSGEWMDSPDLSITDNQLGGQTLGFLHDCGQLCSRGQLSSTISATLLDHISRGTKTYIAIYINSV